MKRHLLGFALFNLIVGTALMVAILTGNFPKRHTSYVYEVSRESCQRGVRQNPKVPKTDENNVDSIKVTQAVLDKNTQKLDMSFDIKRETPSTQKIKLELTFFQELPKEYGYFQNDVHTEYVNLSPNFGGDDSNVLSTTSSYKWLNKLKDGTNLYVRAEIINETQNNSKDALQKSVVSDFVPVLLMNKK